LRSVSVAEAVATLTSVAHSFPELDVAYWMRRELLARDVIA